MNEFRKLIENLDVLFEQKETYTKSELTPVIFGKPAGPGMGSSLPQPSGEKPDKVEVINIEKPKSGQQQQGESGEPAPGEKKEMKPGEGGDKKEQISVKQPTRDSHAILDTSDKNETKEMAEKILEKAEQERKERNIEGERGEDEGGYMEKLRELHKPKINWVQELRKKVTEFKSRTASTINKMSRKPSERYKEGEGVQKSKSYITYLRDPKSHTPGQNIIFKGPYVKAPISEIVLIVALDTSGSIGKDTIKKVFSEMDKIAMSFKRGFSAGSVKLEGRVYFMTWDTAVHKVIEYKPGEWEKVEIHGGGGTDLADSVFKYMKDHTLYDPDKSGAALLNLIKKPTPTGMSKDDIVIPIKGGTESPTAIVSPFLIIATDGEFGSVGEKDLGMLFKDNHKNILYLIIDGTSEHAYPKNVINYETYRI